MATPWQRPIGGIPGSTFGFTVPRGWSAFPRRNPRGTREEPCGTQNADVDTPLRRAILNSEMPYRDPEKQREYKRNWQREKRERDRQERAEGAGTQLQSPDDVLEVIEEQVDALRRDRRLRSTERAKAIALLTAQSLKVIEARDVGRKVAGIASVVSRREPATMLGRSEAA